MFLSNIFECWLNSNKHLGKVGNNNGRTTAMKATKMQKMIKNNTKIDSTEKFWDQNCLFFFFRKTTSKFRNKRMDSKIHFFSGGGGGGEEPD